MGTSVRPPRLTVETTLAAVVHRDVDVPRAFVSAGDPGTRVLDGDVVMLKRVRGHYVYATGERGPSTEFVSVPCFVDREGRRDGPAPRGKWCPLTVYQWMMANPVRVATRTRNGALYSTPDAMRRPPRNGAPSREVIGPLPIKALHHYLVGRWQADGVLPGRINFSIERLYGLLDFLKISPKLTRQNPDPNIDFTPRVERDRRVDFPTRGMTR